MLLTDRPEPKGKRRKKIRRAVPAPALMSWPFEGASLLDELDEETFSLFQIARDVALWLEVPAETRHGLLTSTADINALREWLPNTAAAAFSGLAAPLPTIHPRALADACSAVQDWAEDRVMTRTTIFFAELAARAVDSDPLQALEAGRANRRHAYYERARHWFERGADLARSQNDRAAYAAAYLSWGNMEFQRARYARARRFFLRAWRIARKDHLRDEGGAARHNLMTLALELGRFDEAQEHALAAFRIYGRDHENLPYFAHDVAQLWSWQHYAAAALPLFAECLRLITAPGERVKVFANYGRAAAELEDREAFVTAWQGVSTYDGRAPEHLAEAYANIGEGALRLGLRSEVHELANRALALARSRGETSTEKQAVELLARLRAPTALPPVRPPPDTVRALSRWLKAALEQRTAPVSS